MNLRSTASPLSLPPSLAPSTLVITSTSLPTASAVSVPSPSDPTAEPALVLATADWQKIVDQLKQEGAAHKEAEFVVKGAEPAPAPAAKEASPAAARAAAGGAAANAAARQAELEGQAGVQLGLTVKKEQAVFGDWYQQVLIKGEMLDYYDISGCYILKPWSYGIWQEIQSESGSNSPRAAILAETDWLIPSPLRAQLGSTATCQFALSLALVISRAFVC